MASLIDPNSMTYGAEMLMKFYVFSSITACSLVCIIGGFLWHQRRDLTERQLFPELSPDETGM